MYHDQNRAAWRAVQLAALCGVLTAAALRAGGAETHARPRKTPSSETRTLPPLPPALPAWLEDRGANRRFYKRGSYNFAVYQLKPLARDLNAVSVGHALAYEDLVTGRAAELETRTFRQIDEVLKNPPALMPDERTLSPTFGRKYGVLEQVFDWTHTLHAQTADVLASSRLSQAEKEREIEKLWRSYSESVPYAVTSLPMNMGYLDGQPYSGAFRKRYPRINGLFWGYHWLQGTMYDTLYGVPTVQQPSSYAVVGERYHQVELYRTDRRFMPMFAETSPRFAARFPQIANAFDNLHMLHDMVNDILASDALSEREKEDQVKRAIWLVSAQAHPGEHPGLAGAEPLHDHRHFAGMPGMGMMRGMTPDRMWMEDQGWMSPADCHHCSMPLWEGADAWRNATVSAGGWTMRVRCPLCARDMSAETKGKVILRIPTEDPSRLLVVLGDEQGNLQGNLPEAVFLEQEAGHAGCDDWSRAFTSAAAFAAYVRVHPEFAGAKPLPFDAWAQRQGRKPDTYTKPTAPHMGHGGSTILEGQP